MQLLHAMKIFLALALALTLAPAHDTLAVRVDGEWREWWRADRAPAHWAAP